MPEAVAILVVFGIAIAAYVGAWLHARDPVNHKPDEERLRLRRQQLWLQQRLNLAHREKWGGEMIDRISDELGVISRKLAEAQDPAPAR